MIRVDDRLTLGDEEFEERFVRASGPGGQNVNKVATAVQLRFNVAASSLPAEIKQRLIDQVGKRLTSDGVLVIDSREHRTQAQNREAARERLAALVRHAAIRPKRRRRTRPTAGSREQRLTEKKKRGQTKADRRRQGDD